MAESRTAIYGAISANAAIAVTKFVAASLTGSSAMLAEGIHSLVDTGNGVLLLVGTHRSRRPPTPEHPFGHGKELYFWSLIVAVLIFGIGGGVSAYEGVLHILHPNPVSDPRWNYIVLCAAAVFEGISFAIAMKAFLKTKGERPFWRALHTSKDPSIYTVLAEDSAALAGIAAAALGVYASHRFGMPKLDGAASVVIGLLLAAVAVLLIREAHGLLIGEGLSAATADAIRQIASRNPCVHAAARPLSMYFGPDEVLLTLDVRFQADATSHDIAAAVADIEREIRSRYPMITRICIEASAVGEAHADRDRPLVR